MDYEHGSVGTTWTISFKAVEARNPNAANLLRLWAFLDNKDLWHGLLQVASKDHGDSWPAWLRAIAANEALYLDAVGLLLRYSLIEAQGLNAGQETYMMHPVVHRWSSHIQDSKGKRLFVELALSLVGFSVPDV
jgi:hypothetical protein